ncbi:uncharacterized protein LOC126373430 [Pectinophora gossypiella]|uniref:uncharacterized protein LOC126373430 n=1 Tax=Pectinophora gossypiella TaxID=13191 RepID=UPI00214F3036|nr:uncharacterized protein LOC126373430 [Pectinophora gossypiella]
MSLLQIVTLICLVVATVQVAMMANAKWSVKEFVGRNAYGITIVQLLYCIFMLAVCLWFFWGVQMEKSNVILSWLVIYAMWLSEVCCLLFVLVCLYSFDVDLVSFVFCFIFGLLTICT